MLDASLTSKSDIWSVEIRVNDGTDWSVWTASSTVQILNTRPQLDSASISATEAPTDQDITVNASMSDVDGDTLSAIIVWYLEGTVQPGYNNLATLPSSATTKGDTWTAVLQADDEIHITARARSFLYHQIRNITGSLVQVGIGKWDVAAFTRIRDAKDRAEAGPTAPPQGLYLTHID